MRIFVTGATGWVGQAVVGELLAHGHQIHGLARSAEKGRLLAQRDAEVLHATLDDLDALRSAARNADAVVHLAFNHDFSHHLENAAQDRRAIEVLGESIEGTGKLMLVTTGFAGLAPGRMVTEADVADENSPYPRRSEIAARARTARGIRAATIRLAPSVHGVGEEHGFVPILIDLAREKGVSAYVGDGANRWPAVHVKDAARLYRMALESGVTEPIYHAVAEQGIRFRDIATVIGQKVSLQVESRAEEHFGWFAGFAKGDDPASSNHTRIAVGWQPTYPDLLSDIADPRYYGGS